MRVGFNRSITVSTVQVRVTNAAAVVHEASVVTESGNRYSLYQLSNTSVIYAGQVIGSSVPTGERITAIDLRIESMGANADISVDVYSNEGTPYIYPSH
jgi:hypothetical protein